MAEFFAGVTTLFRGFGWWRRRPGLMLIGLLPPLIVVTGIVVIVLATANGAEPTVRFLTPFADGWAPALRDLLRIVLASALLLGVAFALIFAFTALTLIVGDPFYERIWRSVETGLGGFDPRDGPSFWRTFADGVRLLLTAALTAIAVALVGLIPVAGTVLAVVLGTVLAGRALSLELTARSLEARGFARPERLALLRTRRPRVLGFGVAVQLCFLVPGGAVLVMPAAVAGAVHLTRDVLGPQALAAAPERSPA